MCWRAALLLPELAKVWSRDRSLPSSHPRRQVESHDRRVDRWEPARRRFLDVYRGGEIEVERCRSLGHRLHISQVMRCTFLCCHSACNLNFYHVPPLLFCRTLIGSTSVPRRVGRVGAPPQVAASTCRAPHNGTRLRAAPRLEGDSAMDVPVVRSPMERPPRREDSLRHGHTLDAEY